MDRAPDRFRKAASLVIRIADAQDKFSKQHPALNRTGTGHSMDELVDPLAVKAGSDGAVAERTVDANFGFFRKKIKITCAGSGLDRQSFGDWHERDHRGNT